MSPERLQMTILMGYSAALQWLWERNNDIILWYLPMWCPLETLCTQLDPPQKTWTALSYLAVSPLLSHSLMQIASPELLPNPAFSIAYMTPTDFFTTTSHSLDQKLTSSFYLLCQGKLISWITDLHQWESRFKEMSGIEFVAMWSLQYVYSNFTNPKPIDTF